MKPEKLKKIEAVLNDPASTENEKEICRGLLEKHPKEQKPEGRNWSRVEHKCFFPNCPVNCCAKGEDAMRSQQAAAHFAGQRAAASQSIFDGLFGGGLGGLFGGLGQADYANPFLKPCEQCGNNFFIKTGKEVYCDLCLAALKRKAGE